MKKRTILFGTYCNGFQRSMGPGNVTPISANGFQALYYYSDWTKLPC